MADESYNFSTARTRLEEIVTQVRKKDTSLEKSLDLLEEGVRLANACTELIDRADRAADGSALEAEGVEAQERAEEPGEAGGAVADDTGDSVSTDEFVADDAEAGLDEPAAMGAMDADESAASLDETVAEAPAADEQAPPEEG